MDLKHFLGRGGSSSARRRRVNCIVAQRINSCYTASNIELPQVNNIQQDEAAATLPFTVPLTLDIETLHRSDDSASNLLNIDSPFVNIGATADTAGSDSDACDIASDTSDDGSDSTEAAVEEFPAEVAGLVFACCGIGIGVLGGHLLHNSPRRLANRAATGVHRLKFSRECVLGLG